MLEDSEDIMPSGACAGLGLEPGSPYGEGVAAVATKAQRDLEDLFAEDGPIFAALKYIRDHDGVEAMENVADRLKEKMDNAAFLVDMEALMLGIEEGLDR